MSEDNSNVPRRLRRFYRHGEAVPENFSPNEPQSNPVKMGENHEENEPWMNAHRETLSTIPSRGDSRRNERREKAREPISNPPPSNPTPKPGLFSRVLHGTTAPSVTHMDRALGLHDKEKFEEKPPNMSNRAMEQTPPSPNASPVPSDIQKTLQELRTLAKTDSNNASAPEKNKPPIDLATFHFTPAGEAPRAPTGESKDTPSFSSPPSSDNLSPRERAEQRRQERNNPAAKPPDSTPLASHSASASSTDSNTPAHVRRRMGQLIDGERMDREENAPSGTFSNEKDDSDVKDDTDFKSFLAESKTKNAEKKKKKASASDDDDINMDGDDEELELFEDDK